MSLSFMKSIGSANEGRLAASYVVIAQRGKIILDCLANIRRWH